MTRNHLILDILARLMRIFCKRLCCGYCGVAVQSLNTVCDCDFATWRSPVRPLVMRRRWRP